MSEDIKVEEVEEEITDTEDSDEGTPSVSDLSDEELENLLTRESDDETPDEEAPKPEEEVKDKDGEDEELSPEPIEEEGKPESREAILQKQVEDKENFIQKQAREIGESRKAQRALEEQLIAIRQSMLMPNQEPIGDSDFVTMGDVKKIQENQQLMSEIANYQMRQRMAETKEVIHEVIPEQEFNDLKPVMGELLKMDGAHEEAITRYLSNPYAFEAVALHNLTQRAKTVAENRKLKEEIKRLKVKSNSLIERIDKAAGKKQRISGKAAGSSGKAEILPSDVTKLSDEALDRIINGG